MKKTGFILIFLANLGVIFTAWWLQSGSLLLSSQAGLFIALGRITGLVAVYLILWQLILIGRVRFLEQTFGFDRLSLWHHFNGFAAWTFIFLHPLFLIVGYGLNSQNTFLGQVANFLIAWELAPAFIAVMIFLITIVLSWGAIQKYLKYEVWYYIHLLTYLAIILAFGHQLKLGGDFQQKLFAAYWLVLYLEALCLLIPYRFIKPLYLFWRHEFYVDKVIKENDQTISVYLRGKNLEQFKFQPGQFAIFRFLSFNLIGEAHPFSFSQAFNGQELRITIKALGDYTTKLPAKLKVGTKVLIDGAHGIFTPQRTTNQKLAFIAGGVGITPLRALAESESKNGRDIVILYGATKTSDLIFKAELEKIAITNCRFTPVLSADESWLGEKGRIDKNKIISLIPDYAERDFYLCGPGPMMASLRASLKELRINSRYVYFEKFSL